MWTFSTNETLRNFDELRAELRQPGPAAAQISVENPGANRRTTFACRPCAVSWVRGDAMSALSVHFSARAAKIPPRRYEGKFYTTKFRPRFKRTWKPKFPRPKR